MRQHPAKPTSFLEDPVTVVGRCTTFSSAMDCYSTKALVLISSISIILFTMTTTMGAPNQLTTVINSLSVALVMYLAYISLILYIAIYGKIWFYSLIFLPTCALLYYSAQWFIWGTCPENYVLAALVSMVLAIFTVDATFHQRFNEA